MATWLEIITAVCSADDILTAVHDVDAITLEGAENAAAEDATIVMRLDEAKNELRQKLQTLAVETFKHSAWYCSRSRSDLSEILDSIQNASEFKGYLIAKTIEKLYLYGETVLAAGLDVEDRERKRKTWADEANKRYDLAYPLIWFDISGDATATDDERTITQVRKFTRV